MFNYWDGESLAHRPPPCPPTSPSPVSNINVKLEVEDGSLGKPLAWKQPLQSFLPCRGFNFFTCFPIHLTGTPQNILLKLAGQSIFYTHFTDEQLTESAAAAAAATSFFRHLAIFKVASHSLRYLNLLILRVSSAWVRAG